VIDGIGLATFDISMDSLARRGIFITFGNASGAVPAYPPLRHIGTHNQIDMRMDHYSAMMRFFFDSEFMLNKFTHIGSFHSLTLTRFLFNGMNITVQLLYTC
jgi:NADPH:quinone reductase-like Zn-dependent oxidoreductase